MGQGASAVEGSGASVLFAAAGVQQGDPLGPFLFFCLAVHPVLKKLARSVVPLAYMDDIYLSLVM